MNMKLLSYTSGSVLSPLKPVKLTGSQFTGANQGNCLEIVSTRFVPTPHTGPLEVVFFLDFL